MNKSLLFGLIIIGFISCKKTDPTPEPQPQPESRLIFKFKFDSTQVRLDNFGNPAALPAGHAAQSPVFNRMGAHYLELAPTMFTQLGQGRILFKAQETSAGGSTAIDFSKAVNAGQGETFFSIPLSQVTPGEYEYLRVSLAYQNYDIRFKSGSYYSTGTVASFLGYNTYIQTYTIKNTQVAVNQNKLQGYWGFEYSFMSQNYNITGQSAPGATTVPNPIASTSPIPQGSCVVTGNFINSSGQNQKLKITGNESSDIVILVTLSTNNSFEWKDHTPDGFYEPAAGDTVVDMGVRGMRPVIN